MKSPPNRLIDFATMQRLRRFAKYWDLVGNSGNFVGTTPLIWRDQSPFANFLRFSDHMRRIGRTDSIAPARLAEILFTFLTSELKLEATRAAETMAHDWQRGGRRDVPEFLREFLPVENLVRTRTNKISVAKTSSPPHRRLVARASRPCVSMQFIAAPQKRTGGTPVPLNQIAFPRKQPILHSFDELGGRHIIIRVFPRHLRPLHQTFGARQCRNTRFFLQHTHRRAGMAGTPGDRRHSSRWLPLSLVTDTLTWHQHFQIFLKSTVVAASWIGTYYALKFLPFPRRAHPRHQSAVFALFGAIIFLGERPTWLEILGVLTTLASFVGLSFAGSAEGINFFRNKWFWSLIVGNLFGAVSALYDNICSARCTSRYPPCNAGSPSTSSFCSRRFPSAGNCGCGRATNSPGAGPFPSSRCHCSWRTISIFGRCGNLTGLSLSS